MQPDSSPYFSDDTPPEWGLAVADYVEQRAEQTERIDGREGEYIATLGDTTITEAFKVHAKLYSEAMWRWVSVDVPPDIEAWVRGDIEGPDLPRQERLGYLLIRKEVVEWWSIRGRTEQTPEALRTDAIRFMGTIQFLGIAQSLCDFALFEKLVAVKKQTRPNKRPMELAFILKSYWMAWSLWQNDHSGRMALLKRRTNFETSKTTVSECIAKLQLLP